MKQKRTLLLKLAKAAAISVIVFVAASHFATRSRAQADPPAFRRGEVIVEIRPNSSIDVVNDRVGTQTIQRISGTNIYRLGTPNGKKENKFRKKLAKDPDVLSASLNPVVASPISVFGRSTFSFPDGHPTTGQSRAQYVAQQLVNDVSAVQLRSRGAGVIVAVIDTGVDLTHADLAGHLWTNEDELPGDGIDNDGDGLIDDVDGWNFFDGNNNPGEGPGPTDTTVAGHGTFIAGLIALLAPDAKIMPIRAFDRDGMSDAFTAAQAIKFAADHEARVINLSFGSVDDSQVLHDAIAYARSRGVLLVAAVGNDDQNTDYIPQFPAGWKDDVISVAAIDSNDHKADFSNYGTNIAVAAPGVRLFSLYPEINSNPEYARWSGTSFAAPLVTAEAALLLQYSSRRDSVRDAIERTATNIDGSNPGFVGKLGKGRIEPLEALKSFDVFPGNLGYISLLPTDAEPGADGSASVSIAGNAQWCEVEVEKLQPRTAYKLVVDGKVIVDGTDSNDPNRAHLTTTNFGSFKIEFATAPNDGRVLLPPALDPVKSIKLVEVRDPQNRVVLTNVFGTLPPSGGGDDGRFIQKECKLASTGVVAGVLGRARAEVESEVEQLRVEGDGLTSGTTYQIFADSVSIGSAVAQSGYVKIELSSDESGEHTLPPSIRPVTQIKRVEIRDASAQVVLRGWFQLGGDDFGGEHGDGGSGSGGGGSGGGGGGGTEIRKEAVLNPNAIDPDAEGKVKTRVRGTSEELGIEGDKLQPNANYTIVVDGFSLVMVMTDDSGSFKAEFSTDAGHLPAQVRPVSNITRVTVLDSQGRMVLTGGPPT